MKRSKNSSKAFFTSVLASRYVIDLSGAGARPKVRPSYFVYVPETPRKPPRYHLEGPVFHLKELEG